jgi:hypothetical protein
VTAEAIPAHSESGSGSYPGHPIPTFVAAVSADGIAPDDLALRLRRRPIAVFTRVKEGRVRLDPRTMQVGEIAEAIEAIREILSR